MVYLTLSICLVYAAKQQRNGRLGGQQHEACACHMHSPDSRRVCIIIRNRKKSCETFWTQQHHSDEREFTTISFVWFGLHWSPRGCIWVHFMVVLLRVCYYYYLWQEFGVPILAQLKCIGRETLEETDRIESASRKHDKAKWLWTMHMMYISGERASFAEYQWKTCWEWRACFQMTTLVSLRQIF